MGFGSCWVYSHSDVQIGSECEVRTQNEDDQIRRWRGRELLSATTYGIVTRRKHSRTERRNHRRFERNGDGGKKIAMITAITGATRLYQQPLLLLFSTGNCQDPMISRRRPKKRSGSKRVNGSAEDGMWRRQIDKLRN